MQVYIPINTPNEKKFMSVNKVILIGRLGKDPETRYMTNGDAVANVSIATSENWKDKNGEKQSKVEWHNLIFFRRLAEVAGEYLKKGSQVYIEGKIQTRKWEDKEGTTRYTTEIIVHEMQMLGSKQSDAPDHEQGKQAQKQAHQSALESSAFNDFHDDVPF